MSVDAISVALSGVSAAAVRMRNSADNVANLQSTGFHPHETVLEEQAGGGVKAVTRRDPEQEEVDLGREFVEQKLAKEQFEAALRATKLAAQLPSVFLGGALDPPQEKGGNVDASA